jgi:hypothetical protein
LLLGFLGFPWISLDFLGFPWISSESPVSRVSLFLWLPRCSQGSCGLNHSGLFLHTPCRKRQNQPGVGAWAAPRARRALFHVACHNRQMALRNLATHVLGAALLLTCARMFHLYIRGVTRRGIEPQKEWTNPGGNGPNPAPAGSILFVCAVIPQHPTDIKHDHQRTLYICSTEWKYSHSHSSSVGFPRTSSEQ